MTQKRPRIGVVGSSNVDVVTYIERMPVVGRDDRRAALRDEFRRQGRQPGGRGGEARRRGRHGVEGRRRHARRGRDRQFRGARRRHEARRPRRRPIDRHGDHSRQSGGRELHPDRQGRERRTDARPTSRRRRTISRTCDLILLQLEVPLETVYAALEFGRRRGVRTVLNPAPARRDARPRQGPARELRRAERDRTRHPDRPAGRERGRDRRGGEAPRRRRKRDRDRHARRARRAASRRRGALRIPPVKVQAVDTTGAGDAFIGGFARYFAAGLGLEAALGRRRSTRPNSVTRRGAQKSFATEAEFDALWSRRADKA